jgi:ATP-dependent Clp protease ATP-binding subunit ClpC
MFERYTDRAQRVIFFARYEASALGSSVIETEHLLLGLLREGGGIVGTVLQRSHITHDTIRKEVERRRAPHEPTSTSVDMPLSSEAKSALQHAADEADQAQAERIDAPHLLLGLLRERESLAAGILNSNRVDLEGVREEVRLRAPARESPTRPKEAFPKLAELLRQLEDHRASYHVSPYLKDAVRVEVSVADERWVVTFFADGRVTVDVFSPTTSVQDESALTSLLQRLKSRGRD